MKKKQHEREFSKIEIEKDGNVYVGLFKIEKGMITVNLNGIFKKTHVGNMPPRNFAKLLLSELVAEANAKK
ncbi:MAG: hypothetical protein WCO98_00110 [bacterium]